MAINNSNRIILRINNVDVAHATVVSMDQSYSTLQVVKGPSNRYRQRIPYRKDATITFEALLDYENLIDFEAAEVTWIYGDPAIQTFSGAGILTQLTQTAGTDETGTYQGTILLDGPVIDGFLTRLQDWTWADGSTHTWADGETAQFNTLQ